MQRFTLTLACRHPFVVHALEEHQGKPYTPNYVGRRLECLECREPHPVIAQDPPAAAAPRHDARPCSRLGCGHPEHAHEREEDKSYCLGDPHCKCTEFRE